MFFQEFSQQKYQEVMKTHPKNKISAASWTSSVYYFLVRIFPAWKQPKKKTSATHSKEFCQKQMQQVRQILKQKESEFVIFRQ